MTMLKTRRAFVAGSAAIGSFAILTGRAKAAEFTYKFANNLPASHPMNIRATEAVNKIREESSGQLVINIFPNNQLGGDTDMLSQLMVGGIDFFTVSGLILANLVPGTSIYGLGFAFPDYATAWAAIDGDLGNNLRASITKAGLHPLDKSWDNGFRQFFSGTKPLETPQDLQGFKIRVPVSPMWISLFSALGAAPTAINWSETYSALQTKVVDGLENSLANVETAKIYEVQKYCSIVNYMWDSFFFLANQNSWARLPPNLREIAKRNLNAAALNEREDLAILNVSLQGKLAEQGLIFSHPDTKPFKTALQKAGFYTGWKEKFGPKPWALLEKYTGPLT
jgi:tripartite ATP-independent transporter DctP family solute receptor